jgi:hypothetical protein
MAHRSRTDATSAAETHTLAVPPDAPPSPETPRDQRADSASPSAAAASACTCRPRRRRDAATHAAPARRCSTITRHTTATHPPMPHDTAWREGRSLIARGTSARAHAAEPRSPADARPQRSYGQLRTHAITRRLILDYARLNAAWTTDRADTRHGARNARAALRRPAHVRARSAHGAKQSNGRAVRALGRADEKMRRPS